MAVYTKTGDKGETALASGVRVKKTDARIEAYGTIDELNSWVGMLRSQLLLLSQSESANCDTQLGWVQNKLFNLGAELSEAPGEWVLVEDVRQVEQWIDGMQALVPKQRAFILPAGSESVARCHVCRTVCRRAERRMIDSQAGETALQFVNRLSDYFFVLSRYLTHLNNETEMSWEKY